jgi:hypothetical protein
MCLLDREVNENVVLTGEMPSFVVALFARSQPVFSHLRNRAPLFYSHLVQISTTALTSVLRLFRALPHDQLRVFSSSSRGGPLRSSANKP